MSLTSKTTSSLYVGKKYSNNGKKVKKPYFNKNFKKFSNLKGKCTFQPYEKKNFFNYKKYFYCKKPRHTIKDCRIKIATERGTKQTNDCSHKT